MNDLLRCFWTQPTLEAELNNGLFRYQLHLQTIPRPAHRRPTGSSQTGYCSLEKHSREPPRYVQTRYTVFGVVWTNLTGCLREDVKELL